jgi:mono/diheme cytochrome c family protein
MHRPQSVKCQGGALVAVVVLLALAGVLAVVLTRRTSAPAPHLVEVNDPLLGRRVYANCQACHGIDGRGIAGYAPGLIAAPSLAGDGAAAIGKILLGGPRVDGFNAVMPPFARLSDAEVAAVVNHVRASWGNSGAPVEAATVAAMRRAIGDPRSVP